MSGWCSHIISERTDAFSRLSPDFCARRWAGKTLLRMCCSPVSRIVLYKDLHIAKCCMNGDVVENCLMLVSVQVR